MTDTTLDKTVGWLPPTDPEAAAFFADARAALTPEPATPECELPTDWPITPRHRGHSITVAELHARRGHATRISYGRGGVRRAMWVGRFRGGHGWAVLEGDIDGPAAAPEFRYEWGEAVRLLNEYLTPGRLFGGEQLRVDAWLPEFVTVCLAHRGACAEHESGHNLVQRRTLARIPADKRPSCGGCSQTAAYRHRFQVDGRWRARFGCRSHHPVLLQRLLGEADGTVTVQLMDDHIDGPPPATP